MKFQLSLTEYSAKYKVSISTLRRRIKKDEVEYIQESGKYILPDIPYDMLLQKETAPHTGQSSFVDVTDEARTPAAPPHLRQFGSEDEEDVDGSHLKPLGLGLNFVGQPKTEYSPEESPQSTKDINSALAELKQAYTKVLSEKEAQILQLKQHIVDLQTLNKALENEADRLSSEVAKPLKTSFSKFDF